VSESLPLQSGSLPLSPENLFRLTWRREPPRPAPDRASYTRECDYLAAVQCWLLRADNAARQIIEPDISE